MIIREIQKKKLRLLEEVVVCRSVVLSQRLFSLPTFRYMSSQFDLHNLLQETWRRFLRRLEQGVSEKTSCETLKLYQQNTHRQDCVVVVDSLFTLGLRRGC